MTEELVIVRQLPEIEEHLKAFKAAVDDRVSMAMQLVCTEETLVEVKAARAELGKDFKALEERRKEVKKKILSPYEAFEKVYAECVSDAFKKADAVLKSRIDEVENGLKAEKADRIKTYYAEYCEAKGIDFIPFERVIPSVVRSVSDKKYKEQCAECIDRVVDDLAMIAEQEHADEIRAEYKRLLNASQAVKIVADRHRAIEAEKARAAEQLLAAAARQQAAAKVEEVLSAPESADEPEEAPFAPPVEERQEQVYEVSFTVRGTRDMIKTIKKILTLGGYFNGEFHSPAAEIFRRDLDARLSEVDQQHIA